MGLSLELNFRKKGESMHDALCFAQFHSHHVHKKTGKRLRTVYPYPYPSDAWEVMEDDAGNQYVFMTEEEQDATVDEVKNTESRKIIRWRKEYAVNIFFTTRLKNEFGDVDRFKGNCPKEVLKEFLDLLKKYYALCGDERELPDYVTCGWWPTEKHFVFEDGSKEAEEFAKDFSREYDDWEILHANTWCLSHWFFAMCRWGIPKIQDAYDKLESGEYESVWFENS